MSSSAESERIEEFRNITGTSYEEARYHLEAHSWDLPGAIMTFFDANQAGDSAAAAAAAGPPPAPPIQSQPPPPVPMVQMGGMSGHNDDDEDDEPPWQPMMPPRQSSTPSGSRPRQNRPEQRGFATLGDYRSQAPADDDQNRQTLFAGGEKSGLSIQNPGQPNIQEHIQNILRNAAQNAHLPPQEPVLQPRFTGTGYTLGSDTQPSQPIIPAQPAQQSQVERYLTLWRNGFSLDDGQFFPFSDPATAELLRQIRNGEIPRRLVNAGYGEEVRVLVNQRANEDYTPETTGRGPGAGGSFIGQGTRLGSAVPGEPVVPSQPVAKPPPTSSSTDTSELTPDVDPNQPQTTIQIRLADGTRLRTQFNLSTPMSYVYSFVSQAQPTGGREFVLQTIFPTRVLENGFKTIEEEGLKNGNIVMRWQA